MNRTLSLIQAAHSPLRRALSIFLLLVTLSALAIGARTEKSAPVIELVAVGDILLDRGVARRIERNGTHVVFAGVRETIARADLAFGNLECPLAGKCSRPTKGITFRADPRYAESLTDAGFDILSLANNHTLDCGRAGLFETMLNLKGRGVRWCGAGRTDAEAQAPVVLTVKGIRVAFVGFTAITPESTPATSEDYQATVAVASRDRLRNAVAAARMEADIVVASLHWGAEYASRPVGEQVELAHAAAEAGADLVLGHHTHTLQGLELIARQGGSEKRYSLIAYSLGNFVFDSPRALGKRVTESAILRCRFRKEGLLAAELIPVVLENYLPRTTFPNEAQSILARLAALSSERKTHMAGGHILLER
jgi:gamma-polyglutamate biosynthesis protein CapA